jgi:hypothetical protein
MLSVPIFSLSFIIRDIIHKTFFKKGKKIIDTLLILALIYCTISVIYYIKFRIDREPEWDAATARCNQINEIDKEYTAFLEEKDI